MSGFGLRRTKPYGWDMRRPGWRLLLPIWACWRKGYDANADRMLTGWWAYSVGIFVEPIGPTYLMHGFNLRLAWGWTPWA